MFKKLKFAKGTVKPSLGLHDHLSNVYLVSLEYFMQST